MVAEAILTLQLSIMDSLYITFLLYIVCNVLIQSPQGQHFFMKLKRQSSFKKIENKSINK